ncbi:hypothetical protein BYT27DRAFT_7194618 [Phlegmacium glaucopus]|nr:hypothetical protein BYT27DRAFT_7194618 [Phlegmacium glaucopus]
MGVSELGVMFGYVDAVVGVDALVVFRDVSVQTDEPTHAYRLAVISTTIPVQTDDVNSATLPPATDELSNENNLGNITPSTTPLESQDDETFHQLMNTTSLSTLADRC